MATHLLPSQGQRLATPARAAPAEHGGGFLQPTPQAALLSGAQRASRGGVLVGGGGKRAGLRQPVGAGAIDGTARAEQHLGNQRNRQAEGQQQHDGDDQQAAAQKRTEFLSEARLLGRGEFHYDGGGHSGHDSYTDLSDLVLPLEESPRSWASEAVQTPENTGDRPGREGSTNRLFVPREPDLTDP